MEYIKVAKVDNVIIHRKGSPLKGTLHLTTHHLIFTSNLTLSTNNNYEFWFPYPMISTIFKNNGSALISKLNKVNNHSSHNKHKHNNNTALRETLNWYENVDLWSMANIKIIGKDYTVFSMDFIDNNIATDVFESLLNLTVLSTVENLYAFIYQPNQVESKFNSWHLYNIKTEFKRQGLDFSRDTCQWRVSSINSNYKFCPTYPDKFIVPSIISDTLLNHAAKYRSKNRIPVLCYYYKYTHASLSRSAQPLPGITKQRSLQDEKLIHAIFQQSSSSSSSSSNIIVDARPRANAIAQTALGGGTEIIDHYNNCQRIFLGIDNIHVMSETMSSLTDSLLIDTDINNDNITPKMIHNRAKHWIRSIKLILSSVDRLTKAMIFNHANILVHCSDGWDRTAQVCSLIQLCLDPYYRTLDGFMVLIEKDWVSFGHKFMERSGHLSSKEIFHDNTAFLPEYNNGNGNDTLEEDLHGILGKMSKNWSRHVKRRTRQDRNLKFTSPIFQQFLDCVYQLINQDPTRFEFNVKFLKRLVYHLYSCQYGTFLFDCERDLKEMDATNRTRSVWDYFRSHRQEFINRDYSSFHVKLQTGSDSPGVNDLVEPDLNNIHWWWQLYGRKNNEMNVTPDDTFINWKSNENKNELNINNNNNNNNLIDQTKDLFSSFNIFTKK